MSSIVCAMLWMVTACGDNAPGAPGAPGAPDAPDAPSQKVTISTTTAPSLIVFRDGVDAPWQTPVATEVGYYEIEVHGPYTVEEVCTSVDLVVIWKVARTPDDPRELKMPCSVAPSPSPPRSHVTGTMVQFGHVSVGRSIMHSSTGSNWQFDLTPGDGTFDLMARTTVFSGEGDSIAIRRNFTVAGPTMVTPPIDAVKEGTRLVLLPLTVTNLLPGEMIGTSAGLSTRSTSGAIYGYGSLPQTALIAPSAILLPTDIQRIYVTAVRDPDGRVFRSVNRTFVWGDSTMFTLPAALDLLDFTVMNDQLVVAWSTLPAYDTLEFEAVQSPDDGTTTVDHYAEISAAYVAATGIARVVLDTDIPGYSLAWHIDFTKQYVRAFRATKRGTEIAVSHMDEDVNGPSPVPAAVSPPGTGVDSLQSILRRNVMSVAGAQPRVMRW